MKIATKRQSEAIRLVKTKHRIWKNKENLSVLKRVLNKHKDPVLMAVERKIMEVRHKVLSVREALEVDRVF